MTSPFLGVPFGVINRTYLGLLTVGRLWVPQISLHGHGLLVKLLTELCCHVVWDFCECRGLNKTKRAIDQEWRSSHGRHEAT